MAAAEWGVRVVAARDEATRTTIMSMAPRIVTVTLNASIDQTARIPNFTAGAVNRVAWEQADAGGKGVNVASFLADFGYAIAVTGVLGADNQELFLRLFAEKELIDRFVRVPGHTRVNIKVVDDARHQVTDINFPASPSEPSRSTKCSQRSMRWPRRARRCSSSPAACRRASRPPFIATSQSDSRLAAAESSSIPAARRSPEPSRSPPI